MIILLIMNVPNRFLVYRLNHSATTTHPYSVRGV